MVYESGNQAVEAQVLRIRNQAFTRFRAAVKFTLVTLLPPYPSKD